MLLRGLKRLKLRDQGRQIVGRSPREDPLNGRLELRDRLRRRGLLGRGCFKTLRQAFPGHNGLLGRRPLVNRYITQTVGVTNVIELSGHPVDDLTILTELGLNVTNVFF